MSKSNFLLAGCILALSGTGCSLSIGDMTVVNSSSGSGADAGKAGGGATAGGAGRSSTSGFGAAGSTADTSGGASVTAGNSSIAGSTVGAGGAAAGSSSTNIGGAPTGGVNTGGTIPVSTAGASTGGSATGGVSTGGIATGGVSTGGSPTGGTGTGGATIVGCPGTAGPAMVRLPQGYCIDSTEVTRQQYDAWVASGPSTNGQISDCSWNSTFAYDSTCMAGGAVCQGSACGNHPAVCVDWCDAYAYCKAVGKRLCGKMGGGSNVFADYANVASDQWYNACSSNGANTYPYGNAYGASVCNGQERLIGTTALVSTSPSCASTSTGYGGIFDMSGNVWEWEDSCDGSGAAAHCQLRGGSFYSAASSMSCAIVYTSTNGANYRSHAVDSFGFRCCS